MLAKVDPGSLGDQWFSKRGLKVDRCCCSVRRDARECLRGAGRVTEGLFDFGVVRDSGGAYSDSRSRYGAVRWA